MVSVHGSISDLKALSRLLKTPPQLLWWRWRLPLLLALPPAALLSWLGFSISPHLGRFATGWRAGAVSIAVVAVWLLSLFVVSRLSPRTRIWTRGPYPASDSAEIGWYVAEPPFASFAAWLVVGPPGRFKSTDVLNVINYYLKRPHERAGIATADVR